jgi:hypothetical protein
MRSWRAPGRSCRQRVGRCRRVFGGVLLGAPPARVKGDRLDASGRGRRSENPLRGLGRGSYEGSDGLEVGAETLLGRRAVIRRRGPEGDCGELARELVDGAAEAGEGKLEIGGRPEPSRSLGMTAPAGRRRRSPHRSRPRLMGAIAQRAGPAALRAPQSRPYRASGDCAGRTVAGVATASDAGATAFSRGRMRRRSHATPGRPRRAGVEAALR